MKTLAQIVGILAIIAIAYIIYTKYQESKTITVGSITIKKPTAQEIKLHQMEQSVAVDLSHPDMSRITKNNAQ